MHKKFLKMSKLSNFHISSLVNIAISITVAALTFLSLMFIAKRFGGSSGSDAYFFLLSITTLFTGLIGALFTTVLLPIFLELKSNSGHKIASEFFSSIFSWCILIILPIGLLSYFYYEPFYTLFSKFSSSLILDNRSILIYFGPIFVIGVLLEIFRATVLAFGEYVLAALGALFQPLFVLIALFEFSDQWHEESIAIALLCAKFLALVLISSVAVFKNNLAISLNFKKNPSSIQFVKVGFPYWSANLITSFATFFFDYVSSGLGPGVLTAISFAQRIFALPNTLLVLPILEIVRTKFSESQVKKDKELFLLHYNKIMELAIYLSIPIAVFYFFYAQEIVAALFQRGAFNSDSVAISATCLKIFAISIPFTSLFMVNGRACESFQKLQWPSIFGTIGNLIMILFTYLFISRFGYIGIPYARLAVDSLYFFPFGFIALSIFLGKLELRFLIKKLGIAIISSCLLIFIYKNGLDTLIDSNSMSIIYLACIFTSYVFLYVIIIFLSEFKNYLPIKSHK